MYQISYSSATSILITYSVRDNPRRTLYPHYAFIIWNEQNLSDVTLMCEDVSTDPEFYQHFDVSGSTVQLALGTYTYKLNTWTSRLQNGQVTHPSFVYNMNSAVDSANSQAQALTDCMGWQLLPKFN